MIATDEQLAAPPPIDAHFANTVCTVLPSSAAASESSARYTGEAGAEEGCTRLEPAASRAGVRFSTSPLLLPATLFAPTFSAYPAQSHETHVQAYRELRGIHHATQWHGSHKANDAT